VDFYQSTKPQTIPGLSPVQMKTIEKMQNEDGTITITPEHLEALKKLNEDRIKKTAQQDDTTSSSEARN